MQKKDNKIKHNFNLIIILLATIVLFFMPTKSNASETHEIDGVTATLETDGVLTISGSGELKQELVREFDYENKIKNVVINNGITNIGNSVFWGCDNLTDITIPSSVTHIGSDMIYGCSSLKEINVDSSNENYISENGILFNKNKTQIIYYPAGKEETSYIIPNSVTNISSNTFENCTNLISIEIPNSVTSIGSYAFAYCNNLKNITIPSGVTSIEWYTFYRCINLTSITIPSSVTSIGGAALYGCNSLTSITIPSSVTSIENHAFYGCSILEEINVDSSNENYTSENGVLFNKNKTELIWYPAGKEENSYIIPNGVTTIGNYAFYECFNLINITIPSTVQSIGDHAFEYCSNLSDITIPEGITSIKNYAFYYCSNLINIKIPSNVTNIDNYAFMGCNNLTKIIIPSSVTNIGEMVFQNCSESLKIYCTSNSKAKEYAEENSINYMIDDDSPKISKKPSGWTKNKVTLIIEDEESGIKEVTINGEKIPIGENGKVNYIVAQNGQYEIIATDYLGNSSNKQTIIIDTIIEKMGDINKDNKINIADVIAVIRHIGSKEGDKYYLNEEKRFIADVNEDGKINIADVIRIMRLTNK